MLGLMRLMGVVIGVGVVIVDGVMVFFALAHEISLGEYSWLFNHER